MLFNSLHFLIFFPIAVLLYFSIPHKFRWMLLLVASCYFYMMTIPIYILVLFILILVDYFAAILIEDAKSQKQKKVFLLLSILANVGILAFFKYFNFFNINLHTLSSALGWNYSLTLLSLALPIGLSFHTFQSMSYTIEVYKGTQKTQRHLGYYAVYVMFFPQLVAGPIERATHLLPQFFEKHNFDYQVAMDGLKIMLWGFFKKVVIADKLALIVNTVYSNPHDFTGTSLILATVFFAFQIYCDFSGYSDIAIGSAQIMGFRLMQNFNRPYQATSIPEFWKRWHISLSTWFKDYLYFPMGGNRVSKLRWYFNVLVVFLVSGLWHGANWTFVIWGALHGIFFLIQTITQNIRDKIAKFIGLTKIPKIRILVQVITTFILADFAWIFFRANNFSDAMYIILNMFRNLSFDINKLGIPVGFAGLIYVFALLLFLILVEYIQTQIKILDFVNTKPVLLRWSLYILIVILILVFGIFAKTPFIYFQF